MYEDGSGCCCQKALSWWTRHGFDWPGTTAVSHLSLWCRGSCLQRSTPLRKASSMGKSSITYCRLAGDLHKATRLTSHGFVSVCGCVSVSFSVCLSVCVSMCMCAPGIMFAHRSVIHALQYWLKPSGCRWQAYMHLICARDQSAA